MSASEPATVRIGIVAGEVSGDLLGAGLIRALKERMPNVVFEGICGPRMQAEGCKSLFPMESLSIIGITEALEKFVPILGIRRRLARHFIAHPPDLFIGVDVPDFNLGLEQKLKSAGIPTMQYVSPTVWAWRGYRIRKIRKAVDHMLTLFPFEADYYRKHGVPVTFVGHPLADQISGNVDREGARRKLGIPDGGKLIALLPGSRSSELHRHSDLFVKTARWLHGRNKDLHFVIPFVDHKMRALFERAVSRNTAADLPITRVQGNAWDAMAAADIVLLASGTATLEAALLRRPMVVTYKVSPATYPLVKMFSHVKLYSLPNNLVGRELVPEFMQHDAVPEKLGEAVEGYLKDPERARAVIQALGEIHEQLRKNASVRAAEAVMRTLAGSAGERRVRSAGFPLSRE